MSYVSDIGGNLWPETSGRRCTLANVQRENVRFSYSQSLTAHMAVISTRQKRGLIGMEATVDKLGNWKANHLHLRNNFALQIQCYKKQPLVFGHNFGK